MERDTLRTSWMESQPSQEELPPPPSWSTADTTTNNFINNLVTEPENNFAPPLKSFCQRGEWIMNSTSNPKENYLMHPSSSSSSSHASTSFTPNPSQSKPSFTSFFNLNNNSDPFIHDFDYGSEPSILNSNSPIWMDFNSTDLVASSNTKFNLVASSNTEFNPTSCVVDLGDGLSNNPMSVVEGLFHGSDTSNSLFLNQDNVLESIEVPTPAAQLLQPQPQQPTMFQDWVDLRQGCIDKVGAMEIQATTQFAGMKEDLQRKRKIKKVVEAEEWLNFDYDDDIVETEKMEYHNNGGICFKANNNENDNNGVISNIGMQKGKKKVMPSKNVMAERRLRKKLNDKLHNLRSIVPEISKMDKASILGDTIKYLKDLINRVNDLQNEMESIPPGSSLTHSSSFHSTIPTLQTIPSRVTDELCPSSLVEVRVREGRAINIHIFCTLKPGLVLSIIKALDFLGLDVQQGVISCFNGFAFDVFKVEQYKGQDLVPEQIRAVLMAAAGVNDEPQRFMNKLKLLLKGRLGVGFDVFYSIMLFK
ncbi:hypothetical protein RIF29_19909 [Crotalaria pallida]|uniref:BHLH domain-containing protein n=1 Tax=Crotalaria pallida TaxID=3830 RepID=A0AAN9F086_CROPI